MGTVNDEEMRESKLEEIQELIKRNRLKIKSQVLVSPDAPVHNLTLVKRFSSKLLWSF